MPINTYKLVLTTVCTVVMMFSYGQTMPIAPISWQRADSVETNVLWWRDVSGHGFHAAPSSGNLSDSLTLMNFEPEAEEALGMIVPKYVNSLIYGGLMQAVASENGARMQAMDSATNNAEEMISDLGLKYNRARQSSITQELTEIIAGANAIS